jgi:monoamine oxidase
MRAEARRTRMQRITRRRFLQSAALAAALPRAWHARAAARPQRVAVVGAGLAGLVAAYELMRAGHTVMVFEALERPGGRIRTRHDAFGDGLYLEEGALEFGEGYTLLNQYVAQFGLPVSALAEAAPAASAEIFFVGGKRYQVARGQEPDWPYALSPEERRLGMRGLWEKFAQPATRPLAQPFDTRAMNRAARTLDERTLADLARKQGASDAAVLLMARAPMGGSFEHVSGLQLLLWRRFLALSQNRTCLRGGNDQLPRAFAERLGARLHYRAELRGLAQDRSQVRLTIARGDAVEQVSADRVVLALPFSVLRRVQLGDALARHKRALVDGLRYESATRVFVHTKTRFWKQAGLDGSANTDLPVGAVRDVSAGQTGGAGILAAEVTGSASRRLCAMSAEERLRVGVDALGRVFPEAGANAAGGSSVCWDSEPYALGAWAYFAPGEMSSMFAQLALPDGRIHFAGEHTAPLGFMEGAVQSGQRVAQEISAA